MKKVTFHLIGNAHLDPVWLWDWREGLNEGITTVRTILKLMERNPDMTFIRGESAIYEHIQKTDPDSFAKIKKLVNAGRWDVVGGSYIQPDTNMPATEVLVRQFTVARNYFKKQFGRMPTVAWAADSFGHSAGLPEILTASGMDSIAFTRPAETVVKLSHPAFWWEGPSGARVLGYRPPAGWYGCEGNGVEQRLDELLKSLEYYPAQNVGAFYGVGNHGGGPTQQQLNDISRWAEKHPEIKIIHSGLHRLFAALRQEEKERGKSYPVHRGELNFCLRGCYSSVAKFKFPYRRTEAQLFRGERTAAIIAAAQGEPGADLSEAWKSVLFNSFHDILPGSSIERAFDDQLAHLGGAYHQAHRVEFEALNRLASQVETSVPVPPENQASQMPFLVWNPHPHTYEGPIEIEASLDYRPLFHFKDRADEIPLELAGPSGQPIPFQTVRTEHSSMPDWPWRRRVIFQAKLAPMSWSVFRFGMVEKKTPMQKVTKPSVARPPHCIENGIFSVSAKPGATGVQILHGKKPLFAGSGLSLIRVNDPWGSWGGMAEEKDSFILNDVLETWKITKTEILESGPERSVLWVRFAGINSRFDLTFSLARNREAVDVHARVLWNERSSRLKLLFPGATKPLYDVPGASVSRQVEGEVPGGRWVWAKGDKVSFGFASDALYNFACDKKGLNATVVRASRYANDVNTKPETELWRPAVDAGELQFKFLLTAKVDSLAKLATELEQPPVVQMVAPHKGKLPRHGSLFALKQENMKLLAIKPAENKRGWIVRFQELSGRSTDLKATWLGKPLAFGRIKGYSITSFRIIRAKGKWHVEPTNSAEVSLPAGKQAKR